MKGAKMRIYRLLIFLVACFIFVPESFAITLLVKDEALRKLFPEAQIIEEKITADSAQISQIRNLLGGRLVHIKARNNQAAELIDQQKEFVFYRAIKDGKDVGAAIILDEPGKWGNVKFIISLSLDASINSMAVMEYKEIRGRPIASSSFMSQFKRKTIKDKITFGVDIVGITGATVSSEASCFTAKKAIVLYSELFMKKTGNR